MTRHEWEIKLKAMYCTHDGISNLAHQYWLDEDCPDGEQPLRQGYPIKIKEAHWMRATMVLETLAEIDANTLWAIDMCQDTKLEDYSGEEYRLPRVE